MACVASSQENSYYSRCFQKKRNLKQGCMDRLEVQREEVMESRGCSVPLGPALELRNRKGRCLPAPGPLAVLALPPPPRRRFLSSYLPPVCVHVHCTLNCASRCDGYRAEPSVHGSCVFWSSTYLGPVIFWFIPL